MNRQIQELDCTQEIVCDLGVLMGNAHFTKKEYATFLAALTEQENVSIHTMALMKNENQTRSFIWEILFQQRQRNSLYVVTFYTHANVVGIVRQIDALYQFVCKICYNSHLNNL